MIVESLAIENFMRYRRRCTLDFSRRKTIGIVGENESGKSTLLQAVSYGIYGKTRADREMQLINDGTKGDLVVELALRFPDDTLLEITRGRTGKNESVLKVAGLGDVKPTEVAQHIADVVKLSYDDFIALTYFLQGDLHQFMEGNKRAYFQRWTTGLQLWHQYESAAELRAIDVSSNIDQANYELERAEEVLDRAESIKGEARATKVELQQAQDEIELIQEQVDTLQSTYQEMAESANEEKDATLELRRRLQSVQHEHGQAQQELRREEAELRAISSSRCPVLSIRCDTLQQSSAEARKSHQAAIAQLAAKERALHRASNEARRALAAAEAEAQRTYLAQLTKVSNQLKETQADLRTAHTRLRRATSRFDQAKVALGALKAADKRRAVVSKDKARSQVELRRLQFVKYMCGRSGIPALLIESELDRVEDRCNWVLERLDYPKRIRFSGYKELAGYERVCPACGSERWHKAECKDCSTPRPRRRREEPTVTVLDGTTERPFALESGGAQVLQSFAVRLAGGLFVSSMSGVPMRMVMLDEVFGMLDAGNRQKLMSLVIDKLATEFGLQQQFVVSHQEDVVNAVDDLLVVTNEKGSAVARWA